MIGAGYGIVPCGEEVVMKYIAKYPKQQPEPEPALSKKAHDKEYYRTPHGWVNGRPFGNFVETIHGIRRVADRGYSSEEITDEWLKKAVTDLWGHLKENIAPITWRLGEGIGGFFVTNSGGTRDVIGLPPVNGLFLVLEMGAGYCAYISKDGKRVLAETYRACSGNSVMVIHRETETVLYVNSYRHGIPGLARQFFGLDPTEVILYDSWCKDAKWWEAGLESPEPKLPPYQAEAEEIEERLRN